MKYLVWFLVPLIIYLSFWAYPLHRFSMPFVNKSPAKTTLVDSLCTAVYLPGDHAFVEKQWSGFPFATKTFTFDGCHYTSEDSPEIGFLNLTVLSLTGGTIYLISRKLKR